MSGLLAAGLLLWLLFLLFLLKYCGCKCSESKDDPLQLIYIEQLFLLRFIVTAMIYLIRKRKMGTRKVIENLRTEMDNFRT
jgi:hypothetical protein